MACRPTRSISWARAVSAEIGRAHVLTPIPPTSPLFPYPPLFRSRPLVEWTETDVIEIHRRHGLPPNPLYLMGARRVGCWPCIFASKAEISLVAEHDPARIDTIRALEAETNASRMATFSARGEMMRYPATFFTLRPDGKTHVAAPIDAVVEWARESGPEQPTLFDEGCMGWGLCDTTE